MIFWLTMFLFLFFVCGSLPCTPTWGFCSFDLNPVASRSFWNNHNVEGETSAWVEYNDRLCHRHSKECFMQQSRRFYNQSKQTNKISFWGVGGVTFSLKDTQKTSQYPHTTLTGQIPASTCKVDSSYESNKVTKHQRWWQPSCQWFLFFQQ